MVVRRNVQTCAAGSPAHLWLEMFDAVIADVSNATTGERRQVLDGHERELRQLLLHGPQRIHVICAPARPRRQHCQHHGTSLMTEPNSLCSIVL